MDEKQKYFFCRADVGDDIPSYEFILKAKDLKEADEKAGVIAETDYELVQELWVKEIKGLKDVLDLMLLN